MKLTIVCAGAVHRGEWRPRASTRGLIPIPVLQVGQARPDGRGTWRRPRAPSDLQAAEVALIVDKLAAHLQGGMTDVAGNVRIVVIFLVGRRRADVHVQVRVVRVVDNPPVDRVRALGLGNLRVRVDAEVEGIELPNPVTVLCLPSFSGSSEGCRLPCRQTSSHCGRP